MIERATGRSVWDERDWDKEFLIKVNKQANWEFEYQQEEAWAYWSAKKFLETCAKAGLSISFSW